MYVKQVQQDGNTKSLKSTRSTIPWPRHTWNNINNSIHIATIVGYEAQSVWKYSWPDPNGTVASLKYYKIICLRMFQRCRRRRRGHTFSNDWRSAISNGQDILGPRQSASLVYYDSPFNYNRVLCWCINKYSLYYGSPDYHSIFVRRVSEAHGPGLPPQ